MTHSAILSKSNMMIFFFYTTISVHINNNKKLNNRIEHKIIYLEKNIEKNSQIGCSK